MSANPHTQLQRNSILYTAWIERAPALNTEIITELAKLSEKDFLKRTHFFGGRYENLYLDRHKIPAIDIILQQAERFARDILQQSTSLRSGFWLNDMGPGHETSEHDHDDHDELLSGVYYVQVPKDSGELVIIDKHIHARTIITPQAGMMVFFAPHVLHAVTQNKCLEHRLSIGMNFGPQRP